LGAIERARQLDTRRVFPSNEMVVRPKLDCVQIIGADALHKIG